MPKRAICERSRRELSLDVSVGVHILLVVEQSSLESQSRGCAKTAILTVASRQSHCVCVVCFKRKIRTHLDILNIPQSEGNASTVDLPSH